MQKIAAVIIGDVFFISSFVGGGLYVTPVGTPAAASSTSRDSLRTTPAPSAVGVRERIRARAMWALRTQEAFKTAGGGGHVYYSHIRPNEPRNVFERNKSNYNMIAYNNFNGAAWCGYFAAFSWSGKKVPRAPKAYNLPQHYPSSQAWKGLGKQYHRFTPGVMPAVGDVLIWQDGGGAPGSDNGEPTGHVAVVVSVNRTSRVLRTVEGNIRGDEIGMREYAWTRQGPIPAALKPATTDTGDADEDDSITDVPLTSRRPIAAAAVGPRRHFAGFASPLR